MRHDTGGWSAERATDRGQDALRRDVEPLAAAGVGEAHGDGSEPDRDWTGHLLVGAGLVTTLGIAAYIVSPARSHRLGHGAGHPARPVWTELSDGVISGWRDLSNRVRGGAAELIAIPRRLIGGWVPDTRVRDRVRAKLGRYVSHPRAVDVDVSRGHVTLSGPILADEAPRWLSAVAEVPGVVSVTDRLDVYDNAENVPALQGGTRLPDERPLIERAPWPPALRLAGGLAGGALVAQGIRKGRLSGLLLGAAGILLVTASLADLPRSEQESRADAPQPSPETV